MDILYFLPFFNVVVSKQKNTKLDTKNLPYDVPSPPTYPSQTTSDLCSSVNKISRNIYNIKPNKILVQQKNDQTEKNLE